MLRQFWVVPVVALVAALCEAGCEYEGIFNFGDSNSDTGGFWSVFPEAPPPNGMTYFKHPVGRASDGRLIIDFIGICISCLLLVVKTALVIVSWLF
ncbi:putative alpha-L-fucosidase [Helianthus annuus]|nr:putative alpha-L-fucosidase [Helianthus annuus]KAJ0737063.1 putative alpha-L-fucosidase [Helianthus annuus]